MDTTFTHRRLISFLEHRNAINKIIDPDSRPGQYKYLYIINPLLLEALRKIDLGPL